MSSDKEKKAAASKREGKIRLERRIENRAKQTRSRINVVATTSLPI
jgi:hypothetical protein